MFLNINKIVLGIFDYYSDKKQTEIRKKNMKERTVKHKYYVNICNS